MPDIEAREIRVGFNFLPSKGRDGTPQVYVE